MDVENLGLLTGPCLCGAASYSLTQASDSSRFTKGKKSKNISLLDSTTAKVRRPRLPKFKVSTILEAKGVVHKAELHAAGTEEVFIPPSHWEEQRLAYVSTASNDPAMNTSPTPRDRDVMSSSHAAKSPLPARLPHPEESTIL